MPDRGHFNRLRSVIGRLVQLGAPTHVFTDRRFQPDVEAAGARFGDLFAGGSIESADDESWPFPVRFVTFAASAAERVCREVSAIGAALVVHDTFAVIGKVVARRLGLPHVNVCAGHQVVPAEFQEIMRRHPRVHVSTRCRDAIAWLRSTCGLTDVSPFWYVSAFSDDLNLYCEPPEFLASEHRAVFEPVAFYGSLPDREPDTSDGMPAARRSPPDGRVRRAYVSFGTVIWNSRTREALAALEAIAAALSRRRIETTISLGGAEIDAETRVALARPGVVVASFVDQVAELATAGVFITHHGLNSTHEAIHHRVPMISYPFFWDQPGMARTCERLGLATPLGEGAMSAVTVDHVLGAIDRIERNRDAMRAALDLAAGWEEAVIRGRPAVLRRMLEIAGNRRRGGIR